MVGVAESGFLGINPGSAPDVWAPMVMQPQVAPGSGALDKYNHNWLRVMGRPKPGSGREQVEAAMSVRFRQYLEDRAATISDPKFREFSLRQRVELQDGRAGIDSLRRRYSGSRSFE